jgi:hypothetical protein
MSVGLWNLSADYMDGAQIRLDRAYETASFFGCDGALDGSRVTIKGDIPPYAFIGVALK